MTQVLSPNDAAMKDFSSHLDVKFRIDDDIFVGVSNIPALDLMKFGVMFDGLTEQDMLERPDAYEEMLALVLANESATRFFARMGDKVKPISMPQVMNVMSWLMEQYGLRPTQPSPASSNGSANPGDGTSLTANASPLGLTSINFPQTDS
jgi:hypothetical protein